MKPFIPDKLPLEHLDWASLLRLTVRVNREIARYNSALSSVINPFLLFSSMGTQEAVMSSRIEGIQSTLQEVLKFDEKKENKASGKSSDIKEVINYGEAVLYGSEYIEDKPICLNMLREMHKILMSGVSGENKAAGGFRRVQNWIGKPGSSIDSANYVPPSPMILNDYLYNWENYIHYDEKDRLIQLAIVHAQFEIIHPFLDGNGRIGRALIPLFLFEKGLLRLPVFYISGYLEKNREEYYNRLQNISRNKDWQGWISFFLKAVINQSLENTCKADSISDLYQEIDEEIAPKLRSKASGNIIYSIFGHPIFSINKISESRGIHKRTCLRVIHSLKDMGVVETIKESQGRAPGIFKFTELMKIVEG